jgi:hypothetical protein
VLILIFGEIKMFKCPECGDTSLYLVRDEINSTELSYEPDFVDFDYGKESVVNCDSQAVQCGNGHTLTLKEGRNVEDFDDFCMWIDERE